MPRLARKFSSGWRRETRETSGFSQTLRVVKRVRAHLLRCMHTDVGTWAPQPQARRRHALPRRRRPPTNYLRRPLTAEPISSDEEGGASEGEEGDEGGMALEDEQDDSIHTFEGHESEWEPCVSARCRLLPP